MEKITVAAALARVCVKDFRLTTLGKRAT